MKVIVIFAVSRVVTTTIMLDFAAAQAQNAWTSSHPDYFAFASLWDSHWYYIVSVTGYPSTLPLTDDGHIAENAWAFLPAYPWFVNVMQHLLGLPYAQVSVFVSGGFALGSALMLYRVLALKLPGETAMFSVVLFCFAPLSPLLQVGYAESMQVFFLTLALYLLLRRKYWVMVPVIAVLCFTRPSGLALALALGLHIIYRWVVRARDPFPVRERVASVTAALFSAIAGFAWVWVAAAATGNPSAYTATELAWRSAYIGYGDLLPLTPWIQGANWWMAMAKWPVWWGPTLLAIAVVGFAAFMFTPIVRRLGVDLRFWVASYVLYLLAVFFPQSSTFRLLIPVFPLLGAIAQPRSVLYRIGIVLLFIAGQIGWIYIAWWVDGYDWTPP